MIDVQIYMSELTTYLEAAFGERLLYVGLQGSYLRGEATEESDIDALAASLKEGLDSLIRIKK